MILFKLLSILGLFVVFCLLMLKVGWFISCWIGDGISWLIDLCKKVGMLFCLMILLK